MGLSMSEIHENDELLLPDDAEQRIQELLEELRESEEQMQSGSKVSGTTDSETPPEPEEAQADVVADETDDFLSSDEADFVDLDAEQLDNTSDVLHLNEQDDLLMDELQSEPETDTATMVEERPMPRAHQRFDSESMASRFMELEQELMRRQAASLRIPPPASRARDSLPAWITPLLAFAALMMSGGALWFTHSAPASIAAVTDTHQGEVLQEIKGDLAALRERLSAVEKRAETGSEAILLLERMQGAVTRMEQKILTGDIQGNVASVAPSDAVPTVGVAVVPAVEKAVFPAVTTPAVPETTADEDAVSSVEQGDAPRTMSVEASTPSGKTFIKGWAVNLGSYYYRVDAEHLMQSYLQQGIAAEIREIPKGNTTWYRVRVMGFHSKKEAEAFITGLSSEQGRDEAWPSRYAGFVED
jgi:hypothetical protein